MKFNNKTMVVWLVWWTLIWMGFTVPNLLTAKPDLWTTSMFAAGLVAAWTGTTLCRALYRLSDVGFVRDVIDANWKFLKGDL